MVFDSFILANFFFVFFTENIFGFVFHFLSFTFVYSTWNFCLVLVSNSSDSTKLNKTYFTGFRQKLFLNLQLNVKFLSRAVSSFLVSYLIVLFFVLKWQVLFSRISIMLVIVVNQ